MNKACRTALTYPCRLGFEALKPIYQHSAGPDRLRLVVTVDAGYNELAIGACWHAFIVKYEPSDPILVGHLERYCLEALLGAGEGDPVTTTKAGSANELKDGIVRLRYATVVHVRKALTDEEERDCRGVVDVRGDSADLKRRVLDGLQYAPPALVHQELRQIERWVFESQVQS